MTRLLLMVVRGPVRWYRRTAPALPPQPEPTPASDRPLTHHLDFDFLLR